MFDITKAAAAETATLELRFGDDTPMVDDAGKPLSVTVYGPGSKAFARAQSRRQNKAIERLKRKGKLDQTAEEAAAESAEFLAACTVSFNGWSYPPAGKAEGYELFKACYSDPSLGFIRDQVAEFVSDWQNFSGGSATS